jgi:hypothetical protein
MFFDVLDSVGFYFDVGISQPLLSERSTGQDDVEKVTNGNKRTVEFTVLKNSSVFPTFPSLSVADPVVI